MHRRRHQRREQSRLDGWGAFHGWMAFDTPDEDLGVTRAFTIGYRLTDDRAEVWPRRFNGFKTKHRGALRGGVAVLATRGIA